MQTIKSILIEASNLYKGQQYTHAGLKYAQILKIDPKHAEANFGLGKVSHILEKNAQAVTLFYRAVMASPKNEKYWNSLVELLRICDRVAEAEKALQEAKDLGFFLQSTPTKEEIRHLLHLLNSTPAKAIDYIKTYHHAARSHMLENILGAAYDKLGKPDLAIDSFNKAVQINPKYADTYNNLGLALRKKKKLSQAKKSIQKAIELKQNYFEAHNNLGLVCFDLNEFKNAEIHYNKSISINNIYPEVHYNLANLHHATGDLNLAVESYKVAISLREYYPEAHNNLAAVYTSIGDVKNALKHYEAAILQRPRYASAHRHISSLITYDVTHQHFKTLQELALDDELSEAELSSVRYALAKAYEDIGDLESAFQNYQKGGTSRQRTLGYNIEQDVKLYERIKHTSLKLENIPALRISKSESIPIIFIIGMPRSGTTLVEQILSNHHSIEAGGELTFLSEEIAHLLNPDAEITLDCLLNIRRKYVRKLLDVRKSNLAITDKMPHNFLYVNFILKCFPEAQIIHVQRDSRATCWSNFKQYFSSNGLGYSYDLKDCVRYYSMYHDLMNYWTQRYPRQIIDCDYEKLAKHQASYTRSIINKLALPWDENCLYPEQNNRAVATASAMQIRRPIYKRSSQNWMAYEKLIGEVFDDL